MRSGKNSTSRLDIRRKSPHCHYGKAVSIMLKQVGPFLTNGGLKTLSLAIYAFSKRDGSNAVGLNGFHGVITWDGVKSNVFCLA